MVECLQELKLIKKLIKSIDKIKPPMILLWCKDN